jgi:hypothetical protein
MKHRVPIHLDQPDRILWGLTARQVLVIAAGIGGAYLLWSSLSTLTAGIGGALAVGLVSVCIILIGIVAAFVSPGGRSMEEWAIVALAFILAPKVYLWNSLPAIDLYKKTKEDKEENQVKLEEDETW